MRFVAALIVSLAATAAGASDAPKRSEVVEAAKDAECSTFLWLFGTMIEQSPERAAQAGLTGKAQSAFSKALALELRASETIDKLPIEVQAEARRQLIIEHHKFRLWITELMQRADSKNRTSEEQTELNTFIARCLSVQVGNSKG